MPGVDERKPREMSERTRKRSDDAGILLTWRESPLAAKAMLAGVVVNRLGAFLQVFLVLFLVERGFTPTQSGVALGLYTTGAVFGVLAGGSMTDRLGARLTVLISMIGTAVLILAILYVRMYPALVGVVFVVGLVNGAYRPASTALLSEVTPKHRQVMIFAMYRLAYNVGGTLAPLLGATLIAVSYNLLFWGEALAALAYAAIAAFLLPRRARPEPAAAAGTARAGDREAAGDREPGDQEPGGDSQRRDGYLAVASDGRFVLFLAAMAINAAVYVQYLSTLPVAMRDAGLGTVWFSAMVALNGAIVIGLELLVTKVTQRWPMRVVIALGFLLLGGGLACYALPFGAAVFVVGTLVWTLAEIIAGPSVFAYPAMAAPDHLRGRYNGAGTAAFGVGSAAGSMFGLAIYSQVGEAVWLWCAAGCVVGLLAAWFGMRTSVLDAAKASAAAAAQAKDNAAAEPVPADPVPATAAPRPNEDARA